MKEDVAAIRAENEGFKPGLAIVQVTCLSTFVTVSDVIYIDRSIGEAKRQKLEGMILLLTPIPHKKFGTVQLGNKLPCTCKAHAKHMHVFRINALQKVCF